MPLTSKRQQGAFFGGHIPGITKDKAREWAHETPNLKDLPDRAPGEKGKRTLLSKKAAEKKQIVRAVTRSIRQADIPETIISELKPRVLKKLFEAQKNASDPRLPHFAKLAVMMGMPGAPAGIGALSSATGGRPPSDAPQQAQSSRGAGDFTPARPKPPGFNVKKQSTNPRMRLVDAMNKGMA